MSAVTIYKHRINQSVWVLGCDYCDESGYFGDFSTAISFADEHLAKHLALCCSACATTPYIREDYWSW